MKQSGSNKFTLLACASSIILGSISLNSHAAIIINEIDYDQIDTDTAEFIELFNSGNSAVSLNEYSIDLINGRNSAVYKTIDLSGFNINASSYFVVCGDAALVANCDYSFTTSSGWFQNGEPDAIALYKDDNLLDSLSYEGSMPPFTEGDTLTVEDSNSDTVSLSRITNGLDTNNNDFDFKLGCITPGSANIEGSGNCSVSSISTVPLPAAAWLFGSGLIGLVGFGRRQ